MKNGMKLFLFAALIATCLAFPFVFYAHAQDENEDVDGFDRFIAERTMLEEKLAKREAVIGVLEEKIKKLDRELADQRRRIEICTREPSLTSRIVCYDEIARDYGFKTAEDIKTQEVKMEGRGFWNITKRKTEMGDEMIYLKLDSIEPVVSRGGTRRNPTFVIRCGSKKTDAYLDWKTPLAEYKVFVRKQPIMVKMDSEPIIAQEWDLSEDNHAAFSPKPIDFVKKLKEKSKLVLVVTPYADKTATLVFPLQGIDGALDVLVKECYNKKPAPVPATPSQKQ